MTRSDPLPAAATALPPVDTRQAIELAEGVTVHLPVAGPVPRALAYAVDLMIRIAVYYFLVIAFAIVSIALEEGAIGFLLIAIFLLEWFYNVYFEMGRHGATPGQRMLGLRVVSETGAAPTLSQSLLRNLLRTADFLPFGYGLGAVVALSTRRFQRLGDLAARTLVIHQEKADGQSQRRTLAPMSTPGPPPAAEPPPMPLMPEESRAILQFESRLATWSIDRQAELAGHATAAMGRSTQAVRHLRSIARWLHEPVEAANAGAQQDRWQQLDTWVTHLERPKKRKKANRETAPPMLPLAGLPAVFRQVCADLALARQRCQSPVLIERINALCLRTCQHLYGGRAALRNGAAAFLSSGFPRAVRLEWRLVAWCHAFFWLPFFALLIWGDRDPRWFEAVLGPQGMQSMHDMYDSSNRVKEARDSIGENFAMFGMYIWNNVGIAFRTFAGGILAGVGALFITAYNGIAIGAAAGYVTRAADPVAFWTFVSGHAAFELTGIVLSAAAGLRMGLALIAPGQQSRAKALAAAAERAFPILAGSALLIVAAALIEGFWSPLPFPPALKYTVGGLMWVLLAAYLILAGRANRTA